MIREKQIKNISDISGIEQVSPETIKLIQDITREEEQEKLDKDWRELLQRMRNLVDKGGKRHREKLLNKQEIILDNFQEDTLNTYLKWYKTLANMLDELDQKIDEAKRLCIELPPERLQESSKAHYYAEQLKSKNP